MGDRAALTRKLLAADGLACHIREPLLLLSVYGLYLLIAKTAPSEGAALANAGRVVDFERALGFFWEPAWQEWVLQGGRWAGLLASLIYIFTYIPLVLLTALVLYIVDRRRYFYYRNLIFVSLAIFFVVFTTFPVAPPLATDGHGFIDSIAVYGPSWYRDEQADGVYNTIAAMPSMHFAWTLAFGVMYLRSRRWWLKLIGLLYPLSTLFAITITGMHFLLDAVAGAVMIGLAYALYEGVLRRRERLLAAPVALWTALGAWRPQGAAAPGTPDAPPARDYPRAARASSRGKG